ncbi:MAG: hypothetical protein R2852_02050 [Bacteroidia bacterium]
MQSSSRIHSQSKHLRQKKKKDTNAEFWEDRYCAINEMERHLVKNGTVILKVFKLGKDEQKIDSRLHK